MCCLLIYREFHAQEIGWWNCKKEMIKMKVVKSASIVDWFEIFVFDFLRNFLVILDFFFYFFAILFAFFFSWTLFLWILIRFWATILHSSVVRFLQFRWWLSDCFDNDFCLLLYIVLQFKWLFNIIQFLLYFGSLLRKYNWKVINNINVENNYCRKKTKSTYFGIYPLSPVDVSWSRDSFSMAYKRCVVLFWFRWNFQSIVEISPILYAG